LPIDASVLLIQEGRPSVRGTVAEPSTGSFRVHVDTEASPFPRGSLVEVLYQNSSGLYTFQSEVQRFKDKYLYMTHSESPERVQRRRYYRRNISLPVYIRPAGAEEKSTESRFIDLGGGGASLENPQNRFRAGAGVELSFHPDSKSVLNVLGNVVRTSHRGSVIHVNFEHLKDSTRDRIYRMLFTEQTRSAGQSEEGQAQSDSSAQGQHGGEPRESNAGKRSNRSENTDSHGGGSSSGMGGPSGTTQANSSV
jgi:hypothetical protein